MMTWNSMFFHSPSSALMEVVISMHDYVMLFLSSILLTVLATIFFTKSKTEFSLNFYEHHQLESVWTLSPFFLLMFIILPSLNSLYMLDTCIYCGLTVNIMGHQWYWSYFLKDFKMAFDSYMETSNLMRLVEVDNRLVIPTMVPMRFLVSSSDVIHSWTVPSFGVKMDAVPGRINQFCFSTKRSGLYMGQCSEICGANHSFMPIYVESVSLQDFMKKME